MLGTDVLSGFAITLFQEQGNPCVGAVAVADDAYFVYHPVDTLAAATLAKVITIGSVTHLVGGQHPSCDSILTEIAVVGHLDEWGERLGGLAEMW